MSDSIAVIFPTEADANEVLARLNKMIDDYAFAAVDDLHTLTGVTSTSTDTKRGWTDLRRAKIEVVSKGYQLTLPSTTPID